MNMAGGPLKGNRILFYALFQDMQYICMIYTGIKHSSVDIDKYVIIFILNHEKMFNINPFL